VLALELPLGKLLAEIVDEFSDQIGGKLRQAREVAALSVDDVIFQTRIPRAVITALEAGDFSVFSSPTYAKSFLAQYSGFLGVEAGLWLDALQPAAFISGENLTQLWKENHEKRAERRPEVGPSGGWQSALGLLGLTCGVVFAAVKGYEFFDKRLGSETHVSATSPPEEIPPSPAPASSSAPAAASKPPEKNETADFATPVPRAAVVR
jgi:cytoskeletal protein RodZ